jgi:iron complex outermembrane receptor protein
MRKGLRSYRPRLAQAFQPGLRTLVGALALAVPAGAAAPALAQIEEIVVTARKQEESLQKIPLTVTAFTSESLAKVAPATLFDLNNLSPGLNYQNIGDRGGSGRLQMRGITGGTGGGAKSSVFLDGIFLSGSIADVSFESLERVEVLPGPQSAQYGRSTFGGAINYITRNPTDRFKARIVGDIATLGGKEFNIWAGGPLLTDKVLGAANLYYQRFLGPDNWRAGDGKTRIGDTLTRSAGGKLIFLPTDALRIETRATYTEDRDGQGIVTYPDPLLKTGWAPYLRALTTQPNGTNLVNGVNATTVFYPNGLQQPVPVGNPNGAPYINPNASQTKTTRNNWRTSAKIDWTVAEHNLQITLGHFFENQVSAQTGSVQALNSLFLPIGNPLYGLQRLRTRIDDNSVEARITSRQDQRLRYAAGFYYQKTNQLQIGAIAGTNVCLTVCTLSQLGTFLVTTLPSIPLNTRTITTDRSPFAAVYFDLTDQVTASFEGRYQSERIEQINAVSNLHPIGTFNSFVPRANLQFKANDDLQFYVVYSIGNNPGTFNTSPFLGQGGSTLDQFLVKEEKLYNYEVGMKSTWLDKRLQVNISAYHELWNNIQTPATYFNNAGAFFGVTENRGKARINGIQVEAQAVPLDGVDVRATLNINDGRYISFCSNNYGALRNLTDRAAPTVCLFVDGNKLDGVPRQTWSLALGYTRPLAGDWNWFVRGDWQHQSGMIGEEWNVTYLPNAEIFNAHLGVENGAFNLDLYCRNCSNDVTPTRIARASDSRAGSSNATNQSVPQVPRRPRQFGVRASYNF